MSAGDGEVWMFETSEVVSSQKLGLMCDKLERVDARPEASQESLFLERQGGGCQRGGGNDTLW